MKSLNQIIQEDIKNKAFVPTWFLWIAWIALILLVLLCTVTASPIIILTPILLIITITITIYNSWLKNKCKNGVNLP